MSVANAQRPLRVAVYPHAMEIGGSQMNAIDLAGAVRDLGHDVRVFGPEGVLVERVHDKGLPYLRAPNGGMRPSPRIARALAGLAHRERLDVLHGYEWPPGLECYAAATRGTGTTAVTTVMSMAVAGFLPSTLPLVVGTERIRQSLGPRRGVTAVIEPPVDTAADRPGAAGGREARASYGVSEHAALIVVVSRLVPELKREGILTAIRSMPSLAAEHDAHLLVVGAGTAAEELREAGAKAGAEAGRAVVTFTGALDDPGPAYDAADVCLAMGGSALRSLAYGKPLVVQGEGGYFELLTPESLAVFLDQGWYGRDALSDDSKRVEAFRAAVVPVLRDVAKREALGAFGRDLVVQRFSLEAAARRQVEIYRQALARPESAGSRLVHGTGAAGGVLVHKLGQRWARLHGEGRTDDFNARPV